METKRAAVYLENKERASHIAQTLLKNGFEVYISNSLTELSNLLANERIDIAIIKFENQKNTFGQNIFKLKNFNFSIATQLLFDVEDKNDIKASDILAFGEKSLLFSLDELELIRKANEIAQKSKKIRNTLHNIEKAYLNSKNDKVLIIGSDSPFAENLKNIFEKKGYKANLCDNLEIAKSTCLNERFILIIAINDNFYEIESLLNLRRELNKQSGDFKNTPFIMAFDEGEDFKIIFGYDLNISDYLIKTDQLDLLEKKIDSILSDIYDEKQKIYLDVYNYLLKKENLASQNRSYLKNKIEYFSLIKQYEHIPGGEFTVVNALNDSFLILVAGDIMGKKWSSWHNSRYYAEYLATVIKALTNNKKYNSSGELLEDINKNIYQETKIAELFPACSVGIFDLEMKRVSFSIAGDYSIITKKNNGKINICSAKGLLLGLTEDSKYDVNEIKLETGDSFYIFSDGCLEAFNNQGATLNLAKIISIISENSTVENTYNNLKLAYEKFVSQNFEDDYSFVCLSIKNL